MHVMIESTLFNWLEGGDKWVMSKFWLTTILGPFLDIFERLPKTQNFFFEKLPTCTAKTVLENPKGPPFGCWKKKFFKSNQRIIPFWNRETKCHHMMALIKTWFEDFFNIQRGDPLDLQKRFLQCGGVILHEKKFCKTRSSSNMSKNALLSASGWNPKLHIYQTPLPISILLLSIDWVPAKLDGFCMLYKIIPLRYNFVSQPIKLTLST